MDFDRLFALAIAAFCLMMIASFVGLVALVSWRNHDGGIDWFTKAVVAISVCLVIYAFSHALIG